MGKCSLIVLGLVLVGVQISYGQLDSCLDIQDCIKYFESASCDASGKRHVCLSWINFPGCNALGPPPGAPTPTRARGFCRMNDFLNTITNVDEGDQICADVPADTMYSFGIISVRHNGNTGSGSIPINGYTYNGGLANCNGFQSVCAAGGNNDFQLMFHITPCPVTTTAAPPTTTTPTTPAPVTVPGCTCDQWSNWSGCSATCGSHAMRTQTRSCHHCGSSVPPLTQTGTCPGVAANCPVDGMWADWGQWSVCPVSCGGNTQTRTRTCTMPAPAYGGAGCTAPSFETRVCNVNHCPTAQPPTQGGKGCKRRARQGKCRRLRRRAKKNCVIDECS